MAKRKPIIRATEVKNLGKLWTEEEEQLLMESELPDDEIAKLLGRTLSGIWQRRHKIYKDNQPLDKK